MQSAHNYTVAIENIVKTQRRRHTNADIKFILL